MSDFLEQTSAPAQDSAPAATAAAAPAEQQTTATEHNTEGTGTESVLQEPLTEEQELAKLIPTDDGLEEIEHDGIKAKVPKELKDAFLRQRDYTQKTQEVAEMRREAETRQQTLQQQATFQQQNIQEIAQLHAVQGRIQYINQNLPAIAAQDPVQAQRLHIELTQLQANAGQLVGSLTQKQQQMQLAQQAQDAKRANDAEAVVMREMKDWSPEKYRDLQVFARTQGVEPEAMRRMLIDHPQMAKVLNAAATYDRLLKQRAAKPVAPAPKPITRVGGGGASNTKKYSELSVAEVLERRRKTR